MLLLNNHQTNTYTEVAVKVSDVMTSSVATLFDGEVMVRDIWQRKDIGSSVGGVVKLTVGPRDAQFVLLSPH